MDAALKEYFELQAKAADPDPVELYNARQELRPDREWDAAARVQKAYGEKYNPWFMVDSKQKVSSMLNEYGEGRSIRRAEIENRHRQRNHQSKEKKKRDWER